MPKRNLLLKIDSFWRISLAGVDEEAGTVDDLVIDREDGMYFKILLTRVLGYIFPMIFETLNKKNKAGTIALVIRKDDKGKKFVVVEEKSYVNFLFQKKFCVRALRSSISSPDGSPIPAGTKKDNISRYEDGEINNMRIGGPVERYVIVQPFDAPLEPGQKLMSFKDFAKTDDVPGQSVLGQYLLANAK